MASTVNGPIPTPWKPNKSRQMEGLDTERKIARSRGARVHPRSGAGRIKDDASTDELLIEVKDANKTHTLNAADLEALFMRAVQQGKEAQYIINFRSARLEATITLKRSIRD